MQYAIVSPSPFICITDPGPTPTILPWTAPFDENKIILEYADQHCQYDDFRNIDAALRNQLLPAFVVTYPPPPLLKHEFTGYYAITKLQLIIHLYGHYARISTTDLVANDVKLW